MPKKVTTKSKAKKVDNPCEACDGVQYVDGKGDDEGDRVTCEDCRD